MFSINLLGHVPLLLADASGSAEGSSHALSLLGTHVLAAIVFSLVGIAVLGGCFWLMSRLSPFSIAKEIEQDHNTALAIVMGSVIIGISIIIAAAIQG